ncbi:hypothetical protein L210DRAFT_1005861 [Boletus edulis BED1]|uniref:Uncharacterized protein n=1 Tax=Boletus edulis BED1 TaxID=1328754 RepID=A0AAD4BE38_BOLED|nr:hypothetical protein L210DRAFT_1005861 [Boletus edulis BED1]
MVNIPSHYAFPSDLILSALCNNGDLEATLYGSFLPVPSINAFPDPRLDHPESPTYHHFKERTHRDQSRPRKDQD